MTALLTDNLPLLAGAPNGIKKLRELILELAVRGKLVPQDPSDEPASELLKRIAGEKARLVAEGELKRGKALAKIGAEEKPFELPEQWAWVRLADLASPQAGFAFKSGGFNTSGLGYPLIRIRDVGQEFSGTFYEGEYRSEFVVEGGDYLISMDGQFRVATWQGETALLNQRVSRLIFFGNESVRRFIASSLQARLLELQGVKAYTTVDHLSGGQISEAVIALPPLAEQHRIVAKVDELMALCDRLDTRQADADSAHAQLVQALLDSLTLARDAEDFAQSWQRLAEHFHTLFTTESSIDALKQTLLQLAVMGKLVQQKSSDEPASELLVRLADDRNKYAAIHKIALTKPEPISGSDQNLPLPDGWAWVRLCSMFRAITDGDHQPPPKSTDGIAFLTIGNVTKGYLDFSNCRFVPQNYFERIAAYRRPEIGDILYTVVGATYGRPVAVDSLRDFCVQRHIAILKSSELISSEFACYLLASPWIYEQATQSATGTAQPTIPLKPLRNFLVMLPPLPEQHRIVAKIDQLMVLCDQLKSRLSEARQVNEHLANALIGQALNSDKKSRAEAVDFSAYLISKLASRRTFGRVAHMKLLFLADSHLGLGLMDGYRRHAAGPLDTTIYRVEERAAKEGLYSTSIEVLKSGQEKVSYHIGANISRSVETAASALGSARKELDRLIALFEGRKTEDLEAVATLYAVWNDALTEGLHPNDEWLINEFRSNWHEAKERFAPDILGKWLGWMRDNGLVPTGNGAVTKSQAAFLFN
ncbi:type I restriction-modification system subunit S [Xanthomonas arboricola pv. celebensis]|uniref:restriction endonuclease subunit S n=1 Tax=Xanthomonas arboricola TaxID=56448 RepID=UPI0004D4A3B8|nr:restriction endonuclease subunit S [Xanthomonas arboricola]KER79989.1 type I restriction-modification system subunit S [Xanthomonas arboricola pv. celebensis]